MNLLFVLTVWLFTVLISYPFIRIQNKHEQKHNKDSDDVSISTSMVPVFNLYMAAICAHLVIGRYLFVRSCLRKLERNYNAVMFAISLNTTPRKLYKEAIAAGMCGCCFITCFSEDVEKFIEDQRKFRQMLKERNNIDVPEGILIRKAFTIHIHGNKDSNG
jgi:hypothetical protein